MVAIVAVTGAGGVLLLIGAGIAGLAFGTFLNRILAKRRKK